MPMISFWTSFKRQVSTPGWDLCQLHPISFHFTFFHWDTISEKSASHQLQHIPFTSLLSSKFDSVQWPESKSAQWSWSWPWSWSLWTSGMTWTSHASFNQYINAGLYLTCRCNFNNTPVATMQCLSILMGSNTQSRHQQSITNSVKKTNLIDNIPHSCQRPSPKAIKRHAQQNTQIANPRSSSWRNHTTPVLSRSRWSGRPCKIVPAPRPITSRLGRCPADISLRKIINQNVCNMV